MLARGRWLVGGLMFLGGMINYLDRSALSVAAPFVAKDLHLDPARLGIVFSSFFWGYALFCFVGGWASDRFGPKRVYATAMLVWSLFCGLTAAAFSLVSLLVIRVCFGMGEGPIGSTANKMIRNWFPRESQASAISIANAGTPLGGAVSGPIVGFLALAAGWRVSFVAIALIGIAWAIAWMLLVRDHPEQPAERAPAAPATPAAPELPLAPLLLRPAVLATGFAFFGYSCILYFFLTWFPSYLLMAKHLSVKSMSLATVIPWMVGFVGLASGGFLSDFLYRLTGNAVFARKLVLVSCLLAAAIGVACAGMVASVPGAVALMAVSIFFMYLTGNTYFALVLDTVESPRVGGVSGFVHFIANCGGIVAPLVTGFIVQETGSFFSAFLLTGAIAVLGAAGVA
ncbi:MAG: MFS transporter, partial [Alphaproteobacteria bacterium]|nr:MFS transporter [Alphaproteobacteria bacterium]